MSLTFLSLPPSVLSIVLEFAIYDFVQDVVPHPPHIPIYHLHKVAQVSKASLQLMRDFVKEFRTVSLTLGSEGEMTPEDIPPLYEMVAAKGPSIRTLQVVLGRNPSGSDPKPGILDSTDVDWDRIFTKLPKLKRLDLSKLSLVSRHIPEILDAASKHCRGVEALILPSRGFTDDNYLESGNPVKGEPIEKMMTMLYTAMETWYMNGSGKGLRQLTVPTRNEVERLRSSTEFLNAVMKFCPNIEYLDGWKQVVSYGDAQCEEMWTISVETWEAFNKKCSNLRIFSWTVVPFADPFFRVFGHHVKPHLKTLSLSANQWWDYHRYFRECDGAIVWPPLNDDEAGQEDNRPGYGLFATEPSTLLRACPGLTKLLIEIQYLQNIRSKYVNINLFGDEFWEAVAEHCPQLKTISMEDCSGYEPFTVQSIDTLTDHTLLTLATMKCLTMISLAPARLTGNGIFEFLKLTGQSRVGRTLEIRVSGHQRTLLSPPRFYAEIVNFLKLLSEISEEDLGAVACSQKPEVYISNPYQSRVDRIWCETYMRDQLMPVLEAVKEQHPSLGLGVSTFGTGNIFSRIAYISLKWCPTNDFDRQIFHNCPEGPGDREIYRDASMYEEISGDERDDEEMDEGEQIAAQDMLLWRAMMTRFMLEEEILSEEFQ